MAGWPGVMLAFAITNVTQAVIARLEEMATAASTLVYETAGQIVERVSVAGHPRTDGVELRLLQRWGSGRTPSWFTTIWAA